MSLIEFFSCAEIDCRAGSVKLSCLTRFLKSWEVSVARNRLNRIVSTAISTWAYSVVALALVDAKAHAAKTARAV